MAIRKQLVVFTYDISRNGLRNRMSSILELHGIRVQESVFESRMSARLAEALFSKLELILDPGDSLRMYVIPEDGRQLSRSAGSAPISPAEDYILL